jgi:hypothetical protein
VREVEAYGTRQISKANRPLGNGERTPSVGPNEAVLMLSIYRRAWLNYIKEERGSPWPRAALLVIGGVSIALAVVSFLWVMGTRPWGGPYSATKAGSLGEWVASIGAIVTVLVTVRQFTLSKRAERDHEERSEAMRVSAWATWAEPSGQSPRAQAGQDQRVTVFNGAQGALFDWNVTVVPSGSGWVDYIHFSSRLGQLAPGERITVPIGSPPDGVTVARFADPDPGKTNIPRFVVLAFTDAWGGGWIRVNGDLQRVPRESHFVPRLVHLRNPAMRWAGILDQADWSGFWEAAGRPPHLSSQLEELLPASNAGFPWFGLDHRRMLAECVLTQALRRRGRCEYSYPDRAIVRSIDRTTAFRKTQAFFRIVNQSSRGEILFLTQT